MSIPEILELIRKSIEIARPVADILKWLLQITSSISRNSLFRHLTGSIRRWREGIAIWSWECMGGIIYNLRTKEPTEQMDNVPSALYQRALALARSTSGSYPRFDQKVLAQDWTYRVVAEIEGDSHVLVFYRRPKFWPFP